MGGKWRKLWIREFAERKRKRRGSFDLFERRWRIVLWLFVTCSVFTVHVLRSRSQRSRVIRRSAEIRTPKPELVAIYVFFHRLHLLGLCLHLHCVCSGAHARGYKLCDLCSFTTCNCSLSLPSNVSVIFKTVHVTATPYRDIVGWHVPWPHRIHHTHIIRCARDAGRGGHLFSQFFRHVNWKL